MLSASRADQAWKAMATSMAPQEVPGALPAREAGRAAYATLVEGDTGPGGGPRLRRWLLLRDRTAARTEAP